MALTDPVTNYDTILIILLPISILVALSIGLFYLWRFRRTKAANTLLWALGFTGIGIGILIDYLISYFFYDYIVVIFPPVWDYSLFTHIGTLMMNFSLALSTFYGIFFRTQIKKIGRILVSVISSAILIILIINTFTMFDIFNIASWLTRILAIWIVCFFTYISFKSKNYRVLAITIGLLLTLLLGLKIGARIRFLNYFKIRTHRLSSPAVDV